mgnify:CR=1 FL=1
MPSVELTVLPSDCDSSGHLNEAAFLRLFERARWEQLARGPGLGVFQKGGAWPAVNGLPAASANFQATTQEATLAG